MFIDYIENRVSQGNQGKHYPGNSIVTSSLCMRACCYRLSTVYYVVYYFPT